MSFDLFIRTCLDGSQKQIFHRNLTLTDLREIKKIDLKIMRERTIKLELGKFFELCMGLYDFEIPDLELYMIFDEMYEDNGLTDYQKWLVTRIVKRQDINNFKVVVKKDNLSNKSKDSIEEFVPIGPKYLRISLKYTRGFMEELVKRYFGGYFNGGRNKKRDRVNRRLLIKN